MTMEHTNTSSPNSRTRYKKAVSKFLLPNRIPNKVGVVLARSATAAAQKEQNARLELCCGVTDVSGSPAVVSKRPLSIDISALNIENLEDHVSCHFLT